MKKLLVVLAIASTPAISEEQNSTTAKITKAALSAAEPAGRIMHEIIYEAVAGQHGRLGSMNNASRTSNTTTEKPARRTRKAMKECI